MTSPDAQKTVAAQRDPMRLSGATAQKLARLLQRLELASVEEELYEADPDEGDQTSPNAGALDALTEDRLVMAIHASVHADRTAAKTRSYDGTTLLWIHLYDEDVR